MTNNKEVSKKLGTGIPFLQAFEFADPILQQL
jgi:hypothetical protein